MKFLQVLKNRKILFLNIFLFLYIALNLFTGERGIFSYLEKKDLEVKLTEKKDSLKKEILEMENKNFLKSKKAKKVLNTKPGEEGFSLVELVVVIAVLAILSAVAVPPTLSTW